MAKLSLQRWQLADADEKNNKMGKALIWLGTKISNGWTKLLCWWNGLLVKLTINMDEEKCPNKLCNCKE